MPLPAQPRASHRVAGINRRAASDLGVAVVGLGRWGRNVLRDFRDIPGVQVRAVCDRDPTQLDAACPSQSVARLHTIEALLQCSGVHAVAICSPPDTHFALAMQALTSGRHVLVEKPLSLSFEEALLLVRAADKGNKVLAVGHQMLYHWAIDWLATVIAMGLIGAPIRLASTRHNPGRAEAVGPWWSLAPHDLSILLRLFPQGVLDIELSAAAPVDVDAAASWARAALHLEGGLSVSLSCGVGPVPRVRRIVIEGRAGVAIFDESSAVARVELYRRDVHGVLRSQDPCAASQLARFRPCLRGAGDAALPLRLECLDFVRCIRQGGEPVSSGRAALRVVQLLEAGETALTQGRPVRFSSGEAMEHGAISC